MIRARFRDVRFVSWPGRRPGREIAIRLSLECRAARLDPAAALRSE